MQRIVNHDLYQPRLIRYEIINTKRKKMMGELKFLDVKIKYACSFSSIIDCRYEFSKIILNNKIKVAYIHLN